MCTYAELETKAYKAYQLDWMLSHGKSIQDYINGLVQADYNLQKNYPTGNTQVIFDALDTEFQNGIGFDDEIWDCKGSFLNNEFKNANYMKTLFERMPDAKALYIMYKNYAKDVWDIVVED